VKILRGHGGHLSTEMAVTEICLMFGWDYETYRRQPYWLLEAINAKTRATNTVNKFNNLKNNSNG
jgi:hypothetical protein